MTGPSNIGPEPFEKPVRAVQYSLARGVRRILLSETQAHQVLRLVLVVDGQRDDHDWSVKRFDSLEVEEFKGSAVSVRDVW